MRGVSRQVSVDVRRLRGHVTEVTVSHNSGTESTPPNAESAVLFGLLPRMNKGLMAWPEASGPLRRLPRGHEVGSIGAKEVPRTAYRRPPAARVFTKRCRSRRDYQRSSAPKLIPWA